jgi:ankyrin repeat protein
MNGGTPDAAESLITQSGPPLFGPWLSACASGDLDKVRELCQAKNRAFANNGLWIACRYGRTDTVRFLLQTRSDLDLDNRTTVNKSFISPAALAVQFGYYDLIDLIILTQMSVYELLEVYMEGVPGDEAAVEIPVNKDSLKYLQNQYNLDINAPHFTRLIYGRRHVDLRGAGPPKPEDKTYLEVLNYAPYRIQGLLDVGMDPELLTHSGDNILFWAIEENKSVFTELLVRYGADPFAG